MTLPSFTDFFHALWDRNPFPWQVRLANQLEKDGWPAWITLPTGTGKTSAIDIAIYALARQAHLPAIERTAPVRIVFAVNRRIVVDEAFDRAAKIAEKLKNALAAPEHPLHSIAKALQGLAGDDALPLEAYPLRGATYTDHAWTRSPTQPLVITTTLDQLGSRLLFRGYACSVGARPMHAALLTHDALLFLDEAHTSRAFSETLEGVTRWRKHAKEVIELPFASVQLTATPPKDASKPFELEDDDRLHPVISARLAAKKPTTLKTVAGAKGKDRHKKMAVECEAIIKDISNDPTFIHARRILICVNRVATANQIKELLAAKSDAHGFRVALLTGGLRPLDRAAIIDDLAKTYQLQSNTPPADVPKLILVATQCIEVGADFDFDALITELAPLDSLRQRFGRLNRYGRPLDAPAWIIAPEEALDTADEKKADPLYGTCLPRVWAWLNLYSNQLDLGLSAYDAIKPAVDDMPSLLAPAPMAPILLPSHLDLLCQTSPAPHHEPEPSLYIHGPQRDCATVNVVLRDLPAGHEKATIEAMPPLSTEAASISLAHAIRWFGGNTNSEDEDAPAKTDETKEPKQKRDFPVVWRFAEDEATLLSAVDELRPGDVLILPSNTSEITSLIPGLPDAIHERDQTEAAHLLARDTLLLNLSDSRLASIREALPPETQAMLDDIMANVREKEASLADEDGTMPICIKERETCLPHLLALLASQQENGLWHLTKKVSKPWRIEHHPASGMIVRNPERVGFTKWPLEPDGIGRQGNAGSVPQALTHHQKGVENRLNAIMDRLGFSAAIRDAILLAARYHDIGKADPRFQAWLRGCSIWQIKDNELIAKSGYPAHLSKRYKILSEIPQGFRHELLSTAIVSQSTIAKEHPESDLLLHLIASHHGYCRASAPVVFDEEPESFQIEIEGEKLHYEGRSAPLANFGEGVPERFWKLTRRFGWWGLAYLETLLRLADQRESANPTNE